LKATSERLLRLYLTSQKLAYDFEDVTALL
jgi:hypothetical protein